MNNTNFLVVFLLNLWQYVLIYWAYHSLKTLFQGNVQCFYRSHYSSIPVCYLYRDLKKQVRNAGLDSTAAWSRPSETHMLLQKEMIISLMSLVANCVTTSPRKNKWCFQFLWFRLELKALLSLEGLRKQVTAPYKHLV